VSEKVKHGAVARRLATPEGVALGIHSFSAAPAIIEAAVSGGLDFVVVDAEHSPSGVHELVQGVRAAQGAGAEGWVRLVRIDEDVGRLLDAGADGIVLSGATAPRLKTLLEHALYAPQGRRGACPAVRSADYAPGEWQPHARQANAQLALWPLVENMAGVADAATLAACPQVQALFVGAFDLAADAGSDSTDLRAPLMQALFERVARAAAQYGKPLMVSSGTDADPDYLVWLRSHGVRIFSTGADVQTVRAAAARAQRLRALTPFKDDSCK
jgi:4-hydroxy-2-oxoheptanedioate aldolase